LIKPDRAPLDSIGDIILASVSFSTRTKVSLNLLLKSVVTPGSRTTEGTLIEAVALPWFDIVQFIQQQPDSAYSIPPGLEKSEAAAQLVVIGRQISEQSDLLDSLAAEANSSRS
jgi:hypothetical protein